MTAFLRAAGGPQTGGTFESYPSTRKSVPWQNNRCHARLRGIRMPFLAMPLQPSVSRPFGGQLQGRCINASAGRVHILAGKRP
jgi:hypothetical protein